MTSKVTVSRAPASGALAEGRVMTKAVVRAAGHLVVPQATLSRILGLSEASISRMSTGSYTLVPGDKPFELAVLFVRFYRALDAIVHGDDAVARAWLASPNATLGGTPLTLIQSLPGLVHAVAYLDARRALI